MKKILTLFLTLCMLFSGHLMANNKETILIINSISFSEPWTKSFFNLLSSSLEKDGVVVGKEELMVPLIKKQEDADDKLKELVQKYPDPPKLVLFIGDPSWVLCRPLFDSVWKDIPIILTYTRDSVPANLQSMTNKTPSSEELIPLQYYQNKYNLTVIKNRFLLDETIDMIRTIQPEMQTLAFIYDNRYISRCLEQDLKKLINERFPWLTLQLIQSPRVSTENLLETISSFDHSVGVIYYSWFTPVSTGEDRFLDDNIQKVISGFSKPPIFVLSDREEYMGDFAGGCYISMKEYTHKTIDIIHTIFAGASARNIPFMDGGQNHLYLDYRYLVNHSTNPDFFPEEAIYVNVPPTFFERNKIYIFIILLSIIALIAVVMVRLRFYVQRQRQREREMLLLTQYRRLVDTMPIVYVHQEELPDSDFLFRDVNAAFEKVFNCSSQQVVNKKLSDLIHLFPLLRLLDKSDQDDNNTTFMIKNSNGESRYYEKISFRTEEKGAVEIFCLDRTDAYLSAMELEKHTLQLQHFNHKYRLVLKATGMIPWTWNLQDGKIETEDSFPGVITEYNATNDSFLLQYKEEIYPDDQQRIAVAWRKLIDGRRQIFNEEYRILSSGSSTTYSWVDTSAIIAQYDNNGKPLLLVGASLVIDQRKEMENDLRKAKEQAEESNRLKSAFIANISHEIRTPLNAIVGFSEMMAITTDDRERQEYIDHITTNNTLLLQLVNDILDLSKIEAGMLEFTYDTVDLFGVFSELEQKNTLANHKKKLSIIFDPNSGNIEISVDVNRLMQVMTNLLTNAIKFTQEGEVRFGYRLEEDRNYVRFYVSDTGCGIAKDQLELIFNRFMKLDNFIQGTGLGLSICQCIVQKMGGDIWAESEEGVGSTFFFTLPYLSSENITTH